MAKITTITNPLTGQPAQVDQLDHTAQQIDDAIARALPGGAIDSVLSSKPNPNLLDNWYFGNPVDQRQRRVVKPNTTYYSNNTLTTAAGTTSAYVTAYRYATGTVNGVNYASFKLEDKDTAPTYYTAPENVVRGYVGTGKTYTIDRWYISNTGDVLLINDGYVTVVSGGHFWQVHKEFLIGATYTFSVLTRENKLFSLTVQSFGTTTSDRIETDFGNIRIQYYNGLLACGVYATTSDSNIAAAKLELGSQQTLAHQENGVWVLNEIPDYGEQLARCQRYCLVIGRDDTYCPVGTGQARTDRNFQIHIPLPVSLRTYPTITKLGTIWVRNREGVINLTGMYEAHNLSPNCLSLECSGESAFTPGTFYESFTTPGTKLIISADL